jgi:hypothetical protein
MAGKRRKEGLEVNFSEIDGVGYATLLPVHGKIHLATEQQSGGSNGLGHERLSRRRSANGTNSITITIRRGDLFFRLAYP